MSICVSFPTIQSGLVLRWYADEAAYADGRELANAGREEVRIFAGCPDDVDFEARAAHKAIQAGYAASMQPKLDVSNWVTHRSRGFLSNDLEPVAS